SIVERVEIFNDIEAIKTFWSGMVEADNTAKTEFSSVQGSAQELDGKLHTFIEAIGKNGGNVDALNVERLRAEVFTDKDMFDAMIEKMHDGESLSAAERDLLYQYLQEEFCDGEDHERMDKVSYQMEHDHEALKEDINKEVLSSEAALEAEIKFLELYLFAGNERPNDLESTEEDRIKLSSYLEVLKNAHTNITKTREEYDWTRDKEDPLFARMDYIEFEFSREPINGHTKADVIVSDVPEQ